MFYRTGSLFIAGALLCAAQANAAPLLKRSDFNRLVMIENQPMHWVKDTNKDGRPDADELAFIGGEATRRRFVRGGKLTKAFDKAYAKLVERRRREMVSVELSEGHSTVVYNDFRKASTRDKKLIRTLLSAAKVIDQLYYRQNGSAKFVRAIKRADPASRALFYRNNGPWCATPSGQPNPFCNALSNFPTRITQTYPSHLKQNKALCKRLHSDPQAKALLNPFTVVRGGKGGKPFKAVPVTKAYPETRKVASLLQRAAKIVAKDPKEAALNRYLLAAAKAFRDNNWEPADEAWAAMNSENSRFYLRVAPDEVYHDPCHQKAGFHLVLAMIDPASLKWKRMLTPIRNEMEQAMAKQIGPPYRARKVAFHMPDFIRIVHNAGDSRHPLGATIGQSLPNWGKVAREGRGRTVVMTNLYLDPDLLKVGRLKAAALLSPSTYAHYVDDPAPALANTILHEAGHNFGPHSDFRIGGKAAKEIFGGPTASTLEELKAQTMALWYLPFLQKYNLLTAKQVRRSYVKAMTWAFGHIARGMTTGSGHVRPYSQLAAVQVGWLIDKGAMSLKGGKFTLHFSRIPRAVNSLMKRVGLIKATGDKKGAKALLTRYTSKRALKRIGFARIKHEVLKYPRASFRYAVDL